MAKKNAGKSFEDQWKASCDKHGLYYLRLIDSNKFGFGTETRFTPENKFDSLQYNFPFLWTLEMKSSKGTGMSFNGNTPNAKPTERKSFNIKPNQVKGLIEAAQHKGIISGLLLNFREEELKTSTKPNEVFFVHINDFMMFAVNSNKKSISREDARSIGVLVNGKKARTNYTYDIEKFANDTIDLCFKGGHWRTDDFQSMMMTLLNIQKRIS